MHKIFFLILLFCSTQAMGSHIVGGEVTYRWLGALSGGNKYEFTLVIYEDCQDGQPAAIAEDNPAYLAAYNLDSPAYTIASYNLSPQFDTNIQFNRDLSFNVPVNFSNACVTNIPKVCLLKKTFITQFALPYSSRGFIISYQRCCRNGSVVNIKAPSDHGATYFCTVPPINLVTRNTSAVFTNFPPQIICINNPFYYDNSATDADGDSLSYEFCSAVLGANTSDIKPFPEPPPYDSATYVFGYSSGHPLSAYPLFQINPVSGIITGTPNRLGRYLVTVCCHEWRGGRLINTVRREFQFVVTDCTKVVVASIPQLSTDINTYLVECNSFTVDFINQSTGGFNYKWDFGVADVNNDTSNALQPTFTYPDTGIYTVKLVVNPNSTCPDSISRYVKVYPYFHTNFADTGLHCPGTPLQFFDSSSATIKPILYWLWNFGDGSTSDLQNPQHVYNYGGSYNVLLTSKNIKNCIDTLVKLVVIENFKPFAGKDTIIVKGESIQFNATGGDQYLWTPGTNLNNVNINNPIGFYPDTGIYNYYISVNSVYGCKGTDTIRVWVVNQAAFYVPTAFTPNGDGKNDIFRPMAVGYRSLNFFRIYNRWGEEVYLSRNITDGWDGNYNGKQGEMGAYYWQISFVDRFGKEGYMKGDVTLIR